MKRHVFAWIGVSAALCIASAAGCVGTKSGSGFENDSSGSGPGSGPGADAGGLFGDENTFGGDGTSGPGCQTHCSGDLHSLLDCNGNVLKQCPPDQGCGADGACVAPCDAAKANGSTVGCDFYALTTAPMYESRGSCYAVLVANTWTSPVTLDAEYGGTKLNIDQLARIPQGTGKLSYAPLPGGKLDPGNVAILFLSASPSRDVFYVGCPSGITPGVSQTTAVDGTGIGSAFHVTTSAPIVAYDIYPYGGAASFVASASLLLPTPAWDTNYLAIDGYQASPPLARVSGFPYVQVVASEDNTSVTISPTVAIAGKGNVQGTAAGQPATYKLDKGQFVQFMQAAELNGSPVSADKPVSVWGGSSCMNIPLGTNACDSGHQQLLPVKTLGNEYVAVRYANREPGPEESVPWRIMGVVDGTTLAFDPPIANAPTGVNARQVVEFSTNQPFMVKSQDDKHPFYISGHMTGASTTPSRKQGDPDYVNVVPPRQYLSSYLFLTDPTYRNTNLVFVRTKTKDGQFKDVTLDCTGPLSGWQKVGDYEYTRVDLVRAGTPNGQCNNGVHTAKSDGAFGLTVWGWDDSVSYAYPAGMGVQPINEVVVPPSPR